MRKSILTVLSAASLAIVLSAGSASAQDKGRPAGADPAARREAMDARRDARKARVEGLTPAQREAMKEQAKAYQEQRKALMEQVKAGTLDRKSAAEKLKAWREANKPAKP